MNEIMYKGQRLLPLKSDIVFKAIFGKNENRDLLAAFLTAVLDIRIDSPEAIELTNTEMAREYEDDKLSRLDVRVKLNNEDHVDIEIQLRDRYDMIPRSIYYLSKLYTEQMVKGMSYKHLGRAISLNILDFNLLSEEEYFNQYRFKNIRNDAELTDIVEVAYLELKKVPQSLGNLRDMWAVLLSTEKEEVIDMLADNNEEMNKVVQKLKYVSADDITRFAYDQKMKAEMDYYSDIATYKELGIEEGKKLGIDLGIEEGKKLGINLGIDKGITQGIDKGHQMAMREVVLESIREGVLKETISKLTHLSSEEIDRIISEEESKE